MSLVVAVSMERKGVAQFFLPAKMSGENVINFFLISLSEKAFTPSAFSLLFP